MTKPPETEAVCNKWYGVIWGCQVVVPFPKPGFSNKSWESGRWLFCCFAFRLLFFSDWDSEPSRVFSVMPKDSWKKKNAETTDICDISGQKGFSLGTGKNSIQRYGKKKVDSHHNWLNLGCETSTTISSGKWRFRYRDPLPAKKDVDKIILVVGQHPGEPKNQLVTGICRVKRGYYCWWKKSGDHQLRLVVYPII